MDCSQPVYGKLGFVLGSAAGGMKALNEWAPSIEEINEWLIFGTGVLAFVLVFFKVGTERYNRKLKKLELEEKVKEIKEKNDAEKE